MPEVDDEFEKGGTLIFLLKNFRCPDRFRAIVRNRCDANFRSIVDKSITSDEIGVIESVKSVSAIVAPVSGVVTAVNEALADEPDLVNRAPLAEGLEHLFFFREVCRIILHHNGVTRSGERDYFT